MITAEHYRPRIQGVLLALLVLVSGFLFVTHSLQISNSELWFTNGDQDSTLLIDTLRVNSGQQATFVEHPGLGVYLLYGLGMKLQKVLHLIPVSNIEDYFANEDPLLLLPGLYNAMQHWSIVVVLATAGMASAVILLITSSYVAASLVFALITSASGFLVQSLMVRTELSSVFFVVMSILMLTLWFKSTIGSRSSALWIALTGLTAGTAMMSKMVVLPLLAPIMMVILSRFILERKNLLRPTLSNQFDWQRHFLTGLILALTAGYFFFVLPAGTVIETKIPLLLTGLAAIWFTLVMFFRNKPLPCLYLESMSLFIIGILLSVPFLFSICHIQDLWHAKVVVNTVFSSALARDPYYATSMQVAGNLFRQLGHFVSYVAITSGLLGILIATSFFARTKAVILSALLGVSGIGMCIVMSMRYFGLHYIIYPDLFFALGIAINIGSLNPHRKLIRRLQMNKWLPSTVIGLLWLTFCFRQFNYVENNYESYNSNLRNSLGYVAFGCSAAPDFGARMVQRYQSIALISKRVLTDSRLNGASQHINIWEKQNIRKLAGELEMSAPQVKGSSHQ